MLSLALSPATADDARFVARHVLEALHWHMYDEPLNAEQRQAWDELTAVCRRDDVLYSYKHATLAKIGDEPVGLILPMTRQLSPPPHAHLRPSAGLCRNGRREHGR